MFDYRLRASFSPVVIRNLEPRLKHCLNLEIAGHSFDLLFVANLFSAAEYAVPRTRWKFHSLRCHAAERKHTEVLVFRDGSTPLFWQIRRIHRAYQRSTKHRKTRLPGRMRRSKACPAPRHDVAFDEAFLADTAPERTLFWASLRRQITIVVGISGLIRASGLLPISFLAG